MTTKSALRTPDTGSRDSDGAGRNVESKIGYIGAHDQQTLESSAMF
jgi:hypothetical protein